MLLTSRDAVPADYPVFARLFQELRVPDPTPTVARFEAHIRPHAFFLCEEDRPVAYAYWVPLGDMARVFHVVVDPASQSAGVGRALMREIAARGKAAGCTGWMLHVKPDNVPALRLYERSGLRVVARSTWMQIAWEDVWRLPSGDPVWAALVTPEDDARVEAAFSLPRGNVASLREGNGNALLLLQDAEGQVLGFAAFDPAFPGANPFRVRRATLARALLEAMRPHALPEHPSVRLAVEEDEALVSAVRDAGGETLMATLRMAGPLAD